MDADYIVARAKRAKRLLEDSDVQQAFADVEAEILQVIRHSAWDETAAREREHAELRALDRLKVRLTAWAHELIHRDIPG